MRKRLAILTGLGLGALFLVSPAPVSAGDITVFMARSQPREQWSTGYGAALSSTWFRLATFEAEVARTSADLSEEGMTSFTGSALLSVPLAFVTPYGGVGVGFFRQTRGGESDLGHLRALVLGAKLRLGGIIVVRGDYRRYSLSGPPLLPLDSRLAAGVGIAF
jgi:hypothetical protein